MREVRRMREEKPYFVKRVDNIDSAKKYAQARVKNAKRHIVALVFPLENNGADVKLYNTYIWQA